MFEPKHLGAKNLCIVLWGKWVNYRYFVSVFRNERTNKTLREFCSHLFRSSPWLEQGHLYLLHCYSFLPCTNSGLDQPGFSITSQIFHTNSPPTASNNIIPQYSWGRKECDTQLEVSLSFNIPNFTLTRMPSILQAKLKEAHL